MLVVTCSWLGHQLPVQALRHGSSDLVSLSGPIRSPHVRVVGGDICAWRSDAWALLAPGIPRQRLGIPEP